MAQNTWSLPNATDDFTDCRPDYNNAINNLATNHSGNSEPAVIHDRMWWYDEDDDIMKLENGAGGWIELLLGEADGGMLRTDGTGAMTGDLDMNGAGNIILDADADSQIVCDTDDEFSLELGGAEELLVTATIIDCKANYIQNCAMNANANTPSGGTAYQVEFKTSGGTTIYVPAYAAAW